MAKPPQLIASVDMGSSSFRMIVARVEELHGQSQIYLIDSLREPVRLGAGLDENKNLDEPSQERALLALQRFGERLRSFDADNVRAVATNAVRVARNSATFIAKAEAALGFPIDVISGVEEARLVYCGVAHQLPVGQGKRLVVDIGGGSTEFILGEDYEPLAMESLYIGCVSCAQSYFADGSIGARAMKNAILSARREVAVLRRELKEGSWTHAIGSSGTARALAEICISNGFTEHGISKAGLEHIRAHVVEAGHLDAITLNGLKADRLPMMPGGLAVMIAVFEELGIEQMEVTDGALRQGLLYDMLGRRHNDDMRELTVAQFIHRYKIDPVHAGRVRELTETLFKQLVRQRPVLKEQLPMLNWAAQLHEIGLAISHNGHHKHAAYMLSNADMPGFSKREQNQLATWVLAHNGKLAKVGSLSDTPLHWAAPLCLRLAALFLRRRDNDPMPAARLTLTEQGVQLSLPKSWLQSHPLSQYSLETEVDQWAKIGLVLELVARRS
ncbi:exopolyphosphatase [Limnobacter humi]|uniref:Exopolyphosphatase n=1 Tax=Limnobacter humi TaxID=1778671 RepID=A0ABT1WII7_9BURK|nr:exopolyphosphatase [Limnobacter humi]MCQ8897313.1 exopolyphosphatase [Limnobacter humi]